MEITVSKLLGPWLIKKDYAQEAVMVVTWLEAVPEIQAFPLLYGFLGQNRAALYREPEPGGS